MNDNEVSALLFGHKADKEKWQTIINEFTTELIGIKSDAEDTAALLQEYRGQDREALLHMGTLYTAAKTKYNQAAQDIILVLTEHAFPHGRPDLTGAKNAYTAYMTEAHEAINTKPKKDLFRSSMLGDTLPVDPTKVFSVILDFIKYFQGRRDDERKQLAQVIKDNMLVSWLNVREKPKDTKTDPGTKKTTPGAFAAHGGEVSGG